MSAWTERNFVVQGYCLSPRERQALRWGLRWARRHPFDLIWNRALRKLLGAAEVPLNPTPRRHGFKLGTVWLLAVGALFAVGQGTAALILGAMLAGACGLLTATNFCPPSTLLSVWWRWRGIPRSAPEAGSSN
jgi:hypothetical protein